MLYCVIVRTLSGSVLFIAVRCCRPLRRANLLQANLKFQKIEANKFRSITSKWKIALKDSLSLSWSLPHISFIPADPLSLSLPHCKDPLSPTSTHSLASLSLSQSVFQMIHRINHSSSDLWTDSVVTVNEPERDIPQIQTQHSTLTHTHSHTMTAVSIVTGDVLADITLAFLWPHKASAFAPAAHFWMHMRVSVCVEVQSHWVRQRYASLPYLACGRTNPRGWEVETKPAGSVRLWVSYRTDVFSVWVFEYVYACACV